MPENVSGAPGVDSVSGAEVLPVGYQCSSEGFEGTR